MIFDRGGVSGGGGGGAKTVVLQKGKHGFGFILRGPKCKKHARVTQSTILTKEGGIGVRKGRKTS